MARSLQARVAARGFPVFDVAGQSGQGTLPDSTLTTAPPPGQPSGTWTDPGQDPCSVPAVLAPPQEYVSPYAMWGLPAMASPDDTPKSADGPLYPQGNSHAAPMADSTLDFPGYAAESDATHAATFTGPSERQAVPGVAQFRLDHAVAEGAGPSNLQPLAGQVRTGGGFDGVQGYGGGGDGPRGTNASMPIVIENKDYPGSLYDAPDFVSAAEVPFLVAVPDQFIARAPELPAWTGGGFDGPTASVRAQDTVTADVPAQGPAVPAGVPAYASSFWG